MTFKTTINRLGHLGDGIAPGPMFVPGALPGEIVTGDPIGDRLTNVKILDPSPNRVHPPCSHFRACGGCLLQHGSDSFLAGWKVQIVRDALAGQGLDAPVEMLATSPASSRRRANLSGRRTKRGALVGMHGSRSGTIVAIPGCTLLRADLMAVIPALEALTIAGGSRKGELSFAVTGSNAGVDVAAIGGKELNGELRVALSALANKFRLARLNWGDELVAELAPPLQDFGQAKVNPPPGAFLQATEHGQATLVAAVKMAVGHARRVVDLFAGCGTFTLPLSEQSEIHAVEGDADMLAALDVGWRGGQGLKKVTTEPRDLFRRPLVAAELIDVDVAVIDPPRAGAESQMTELAGANVPVVVSVSCNPVTFARDARILCDAGFTLGPVAVVDQFRWSPHVELVARFAKN